MKKEFIELTQKIIESKHQAHICRNKINEVRKLVDEYFKEDPKMACDEDRDTNQVGCNGELIKTVTRMSGEPRQTVFTWEDIRQGKHLEPPTP